MKSKRKVLVIFMLLVSSPLFIQSEQLESALIYTEKITDGGVLSSLPIVDNEGNLHTFVHLRSTAEDKLIHLYETDGKLTETTIIDDITDVRFYENFIYNGSIYIIFSAVNPLGTFTMYEYKWSETAVTSTPILTIANSVLAYINYFKTNYDNGVLHVFHNRYYGPNNEYMKITHYFGLTNYEKEDIEVPNPYNRVGLDFVIGDNVIWYIYQQWETAFTQGEFQGDFGIAKIENQILTPVKTAKFKDEIIGTVGTLKAVKSTNNDSILNFAFFEPKKLYYGTFNGTHITNQTQDLNIQYNYENFDYEKTSGTQQMLLATKPSGSNYVSIFKGNYRNDTNMWEFIPILSESKIVYNGYSSFLTEENYVLLYNSTTSTNNLRTPVGMKYRSEEAIGLFYITNFEIEIKEAIIDEGLELYNPLKEFIVNNVILVSILGLLLIILLVLGFIYWRRKSTHIKSFLFDTNEVGKHSKFVLFFLNSWRFIVNAADLIKTIGFSNKKRTLITLGGFIITGYLLGSAIIISQSEQSSMVKSFYSANNVSSNGAPTARLTTNIINIQDQPPSITPFYDDYAKQEIASLIDDYTLNSYFKGIQSVYYTYVDAKHPTVDSISDAKISTFPDYSDEYFDSIITNGTIPKVKNEVLVQTPLLNKFGLQINDTITIYLDPSSGSLDSEELANYTLSLKIVGHYERMTSTELKRISSFLGASNDIYTLIETSQIITRSSYFFDLLASSYKMNLQLRGIYQFELDFEDFRIEERTVILEEQEEFIGKTFAFSFDTSSALFFSKEIVNFFENFNNYYLQNMTRLFIFAFPAILLSIFMIFESSELFSSSYVQEIEILRNRGVKRRRITAIYIGIRFIEVILATLTSYGLAILTSIPLIRVNGFLSFTNTDTELRIGNLPVEMALTALILFAISIPRILMIIGREKKVEKTPSRLKKLLKNISWRDVTFLLVGVSFFIVFYYLAFNYSGTNANRFPLYLNLTIIGALFALIGGLPLLMKLLSMLWKGIGTLIWKGEKKNKFKFVFSEISKDIKYFENITLIFLLLISILIPSMIVPYTKESTLTEQSYFMNGAEIMVPDWHKQNVATIEEIEQIEGVASTSYVELYTMYSGYYHGTKLLVLNTTKFLKTAHEPPEKIVGLDWEKINTLTKDTVFISHTMSAQFRKDIGDKIFLIHPDASFDTNKQGFFHPENHTMTITDFFDLFPVYFLEENAIDEENMMVMSAECFAELRTVIVTRLLTSSALLIKPENPKQSNEVADQVFIETGGFYVSTVEKLKNSLKTPLYNIFVIEMILSLFVAGIILIFSSFTTATKILEKRIIKHDIMKKMGINVNSIVNLSTIECFIAAVLPSLALGSVFGFIVIKPMLNLLSYGAEPYPMTTQYPVIWLIVGFLALPVILYLNLNFILKREFARYTPTQLE